jgi:hypothetical protein
MADNTLQDFENLGNQIKDAFTQLEANRLNLTNKLTTMSETTNPAVPVAKPIVPATTTTTTTATPAVNNTIPQSEGMYIISGAVNTTQSATIPKIGEANGTNRDRLILPVTPVETPAGSGHYEVDITNLARNYRGGANITDRASQLSASITKNGLQSVGGEIRNAVVTIDQADATSAPKVKLSFDAVPKRSQQISGNINSKTDNNGNATPNVTSDVTAGFTYQTGTGEFGTNFKGSVTNTEQKASQTLTGEIGAPTTTKPAISSVIVTIDSKDLNNGAKAQHTIDTANLPNATTTNQNQTPKLGR